MIHASQSHSCEPHCHELKASQSGNWLGSIGIICFVLAGGFIIKLAIDSGWLTPERQIGLAALLGLSLIAAGFWIEKFDKPFASLLPGGGITVLYLTAFAAHSWHGLISFQIGIAAVTLVSALCIWIYTRVRHDFYPIAAAVGSYLAPLLFGSTSQSDFTIYYFVACSEDERMRVVSLLPVMALF